MTQNTTFIQTIIASPQWKAWVKENEQNPKWDVHESMDCGWLSEGHFQAFLAFVKGMNIHPDDERIIEEFDAFLDKYTGKHDKDSWIRQTFYEDTVQVRKDLIVKEFRTTLATLRAEHERELEEVRREERERLGMGGMCMVANYPGKAVMLAGNSELAYQFIKEVIEPSLTPTDPLPAEDVR